MFIKAKEKTEENDTQPEIKGTKKKASRRTIITLLSVLLAIPLTIFAGIYLLGDRKYYLISLMIILEILVPFCISFEGRKPNARELVIISTLCAITVAGRIAFTALPQIKPVIPLIIISGMAFGGETGFLVGAVTGFVSNFFFGQGPWTPWQMFAFGMVGFVSGIVMKKEFMCKSRIVLCVFGFLATVIIYGGIMNPASVLMMQTNPTPKMIIASYAGGLPYDLIHGAAAAVFLLIIGKPIQNILERIKAKYGLDTECI